MRFSAKNKPSIFLILLALFISGCAYVGPKSIKSARFSYNEAVIQTWNEQMLLNLVRLKYRDTPYFLEISSVSTQYNLGALGAAGAGFELDTSGGTTLNSNAALSYEERPTITYSPLQGEKFARQIMSAIPLTTVLLLGKSGWRIDRVLRICIQEISNIPNASRAAGPTPSVEPRYAEFRQIAELFREIQDRDLFRVGISRTGDKRNVLLSIKDDGRKDPKVKELYRLLDINPGVNPVPLISNPLNESKSEVVIITRSLMGVLFYLSQAIEVPEEDRGNGKVTLTKKKKSDELFDWQEVTGGIFSVRSSKNEPDNAFVKIKYRNSWFYVEDNDLGSKSTFMLLAQLFWLQSGHEKSVEPLLTLPIGG